MDIKEIVKNAPEGAEFYGFDRDGLLVYYKDINPSGGYMFSMYGDDWDDNDGSPACKTLYQIPNSSQQESEYDRGMRKAMQAIAKSCGKKFAVDVGYEDLPALVESMINPPKPPKTRTEYVKVKTFNFADLKDAFDKGELFTGDLGEYRKVVNEVAIPAALCNNALYRRIEKEVDWREEVSEFIEAKAQDSSNCNTFTSVGLRFLTERSFLEMCRIALRATGELD